MLIYYSYLNYNNLIIIYMKNKTLRKINNIRNKSKRKINNILKKIPELSDKQKEIICK